MANTGHPDFDNSPLIQTTAQMVNMQGNLTSPSDTVVATAAITNTTTLVGMLGNIAWAGGGGPFEITTTFTFTGNLGGTFKIVIGAEAPGGSPVGYNTPFTFPVAVPVRVAALLGVSGNTTLTITATSVITGGTEIVAANIILAA